MPKLISIETMRYSEFFRRLFAEYADGVTIEIDSRRLCSSDIPQLLTDWCTNAEIARTQHFRLLRGEAELFSFHDHPRELFAAYTELPFVQRLHGEHVLRYRVLEDHTHEPSKLFSCLRRLFGA
jgi:hypothetical protein